MSSKKYTDTPADLNKAYEQNDIQLKGILGFGIGLFLLIVITFGLMSALLSVLKDYSKEGVVQNPLAMNDKERLPPEPRLQLAPGFGVDSETGRVNMELGAPQAEYWELSRQWKELWEKGHKDAKTGTVTIMPIKEAKERFLSQNAKARSGPDADKAFKESRMFVSDSSSGRLASEVRR